MHKSLKDHIFQYRNWFYKNCPYGGSKEKCEYDVNCKCKIFAEIFSQIDYVISPHFKYITSSKKKYTGSDIDEFNGIDLDKEKILSYDKVELAKKKIFKYCWNMDEIEYDLSRNELNKMSVMNDNYLNGTNVVIYGDKSKIKDFGIQNNIQSGKTMVASIIMQEAIWSQFKCKVNSFYWLRYDELQLKLREKDSDINEIKYCDWLVIDPIPKPSMEEIKNFYVMEDRKRFNEFLSYRIKNRLPSILVFQFNIMKYLKDIENLFGYSVEEIINNKNSVKIEL